MGYFQELSCNQYITDREIREELRTTKAELDRLEGGSTFDIYAESEE